MLLHKGDFVRFRWNGRLHDGHVREDERPGLGLVDVETDKGVWHGLSRRAITPCTDLSRRNAPWCRGSDFRS
jgi:hypothetical protein